MKQIRLELLIGLFAIIFTLGFTFSHGLDVQAADVAEEGSTSYTEDTTSTKTTTENTTEESTKKEEGTSEADKDVETTTEASNSGNTNTTPSNNNGTINNSSNNASNNTNPSNNNSSSGDEKESTNLDRWMNICETLGNNLKKRKFRYSNSGTRSTYKAALSGRRKANCALYVSWALQQYGALKPGQTFYIRRSGSIKKNFRKWGKNVKVIRVYKRTGSANLQKGDIVCWAGIGHTNIYAGRNKSGDRIWYDAGKAATYGHHSGSRFEDVGTTTQGYLDSRKVAYIIRIKNV